MREKGREKRRERETERERERERKREIGRERERERVCLLVSSFLGLFPFFWVRFQFSNKSFKFSVY